jgi:hypothetical protein
LNPYAEKARGEKNPKIRLLSNGTDNELIKHTHTLKDSGLSFYGNIEARNLSAEKCKTTTYGRIFIESLPQCNLENRSVGGIL